MATFPSMPLFTDAYIADTTHLSAEEHGVYFLLLVCAWRTEGCKLKNDDVKLARMGRVTPAKWRKIKDTILEFWTEDGEYLKQKKLTEIYEKVQKNVEQKKKAGKASADAKSLENNKSASTAVPTAKQRGASGKSTNQNQNHISTNVDKKKAKKIPSEFEEFWDGYAFKNSRGHAEKAFAKLTPEDQKLAIAAAPKHAAFHKAKNAKEGREANEFRQHPATWLNAKGWEDELEGEVKKVTFDPSSVEDWFQRLGTKPQPFMRPRLENNWPAGAMGPNPWKQHNSIIPKEVREVFANDWRWV